MKRSALIIDDNRGDIELLKIYLLEEGWEHQVLWAKDGKEGIDIARKNNPAVVFLDINMPGVDGYEVCRELKSFGNKSPYIIVISGTQDPTAEVTAKSYGADDYCRKQAGLIFNKLKHYYQIESGKHGRESV